MIADLAVRSQANEIVMPDFMGECDTTLTAGTEFTTFLDAYSGPDRPFTLAGVVQGKGFAEWMKCVAAYVHWPVFVDVQTIMFPRCMNRSEHEHTDRTQFMKGIFKSHLWQEYMKLKPNLKVHCLGASPWVREVETIASFPEVRSMDTSLPVALGLDGIDIKRDIYCGRQTDFFDINPANIPPGLLEIVNDNCRVFREWARDTSETASPSEV